MAVGETEEERRKAKLASIKTKVKLQFQNMEDGIRHEFPLQVNYIFEIEDSVPFLRKFSFFDTSTGQAKITLDEVTRKEFQDRNTAVIDEIKVQLYYFLLMGLL